MAQCISVDNFHFLANAFIQKTTKIFQLKLGTVNITIMIEIILLLFLFLANEIIRLEITSIWIKKFFIVDHMEIGFLTPKQKKNNKKQTASTKLEFFE